MDRKYLFFDIDGTLAAGGYEHTYVPESTMLALRKLREAGHFLCIATGRSNGMAVAFMDAFEIKNMVSDGGNGLTVDGELVGIDPLPHDLVEQLIKECASSWTTRPGASARTAASSTSRRTTTWRPLSCPVHRPTTTTASTR